MDVVIIGAGGHGRVVLDILQAAGLHRAVAFLDADPTLRGSHVGGVPVLGPINLLPKLWAQQIRTGIVAIGDNRTRRRHGELLLEHGFDLASAIHPTASVSKSARIGKNVVIAPLAAICTEATVGDYAIVNTGAIVDHECQIGVAAHITPGAKLAGRVCVGEEAFIGLGANIIQCLNVGRSAVIGAGAVVLHNVPDGLTVAGVPAAAIRRRTEGPAGGSLPAE